MEDLIRKLTDLLHQGFRGSDLELAVTVPGYKVGGFIAWAGFEGLDAVNRQDRVWDLVEGPPVTR